MVQVSEQRSRRRGVRRAHHRPGQAAARAGRGPPGDAGAARRRTPAPTRAWWRRWAGNVSQETLRDLFQTESWWQPFRESFATPTWPRPAAGRSSSPAAPRLPLDGRGAGGAGARQPRVASALLAADGWAHAVVAVPVVMPNPAHTPVLLLTQPFEAQALGQMAERTGEAVVLSDGTPALLGAGPGGARPRAAAGHRPATAAGPASLPDGAGGGRQRGGARPVAARPRGHRAAVGRATARLTVAAHRAWARWAAALFLLLLWSARGAACDRRRGARPADGADPRLRRPRPAPAAATCCCNGWAAAAWPRCTWRWRWASAASAAPAWSSGCAPSWWRTPPRWPSSPTRPRWPRRWCTPTSSPSSTSPRWATSTCWSRSTSWAATWAALVRRAATPGQDAAARASWPTSGSRRCKALDYAHAKRDHDGAAAGHRAPGRLAREHHGHHARRGAAARLRRA